VAATCEAEAAVAEFRAAAVFIAAVCRTAAVAELAGVAVGAALFDDDVPATPAFAFGVAENNSAMVVDRMPGVPLSRATSVPNAGSICWNCAVSQGR
jgi:hypothetical protein